MLLRTHFTITIFAVLLFILNVNHKLAFVVVALIATAIPDVDSRFSKVGRRKINRILQFFTKHRGMTHSFIFLILVTFGIVFVSPVVALGFFVGYSIHLFADSFTKDGITPFYPFLDIKSSGKISTGGKAEVLIFTLFLLFDIGLFFVKIGKVF